MRVIARHTLVGFWRRHRETEPSLRDWLSVVRRADWSSMADVKAVFARASILDGERVAFDVLGGNYPTADRPPASISSKNTNTLRGFFFLSPAAVASNGAWVTPDLVMMAHL